MKFNTYYVIIAPQGVPIIIFYLFWILLRNLILYANGTASRWWIIFVVSTHLNLFVIHCCCCTDDFVCTTEHHQEKFNSKLYWILTDADHWLCLSPRMIIWINGKKNLDIIIKSEKIDYRIMQIKLNLILFHLSCVFVWYHVVEMKLLYIYFV